MNKLYIKIKIIFLNTKKSVKVVAAFTDFLLEYCFIQDFMYVNERYYSSFYTFRA